jgi:hypothetical protein
MQEFKSRDTLPQGNCRRKGAIFISFHSLRQAAERMTKRRMKSLFRRSGGKILHGLSTKFLDAFIPGTFQFAQLGRL